MGVFRVFVCVLAVAAIAVGTASAIESPSGARRTLEPAWVDARGFEIEPESDAPGSAGARSFVALRGGQWRFRVDSRTGLATLVEGSGVPLVPGLGNALGEAALDGLDLQDGELSAIAVAPRVRAFLDSHAELVMPRGGVLELVPEESFALDGGRRLTVTFLWRVDGVEVERARVFANLNAGNVTQFGAPLVGGRIPATRPVVDGAGAIAIVLAWSGDGEVARLDRDPDLLLQPESDASGLWYRLVWVVRYGGGRPSESWEGRVDALTGEVVAFRSGVVHGRVTGGVYARTVTDPEVVVPMPLVDVATEQGTVTSDVDGAFLYGGGEVGTTLSGRHFNLNCADGCSVPSQVSAWTSIGAGLLDLGVGGNQQIGNGVSTRAERNAFFHLNRARRIAKGWLPSLSWIDQPMAVNVNIASTCNASYNSATNATNFFRAGGGCNNTGEIADVMHHEWGHGIDLNTRGADGATGEGTADVVSLHMNHSSQIGPYFRVDGQPVRDVDSAVSPNGLMTRSNIATKCATGGGALGYAVHCEGQLLGQSMWDLSQKLVVKHGYHTGWRTSERLFFTSLPNQGSYLPEGTFPIYSALINADDDDGNLANGTPNGQQIYDAFLTHEIAGTPATSSAGCARPAQPTLSATPGCDRVALTWSAVAGATSYRVLRSETRLEAPLFVLATVPATQTSYQDLAVWPGVDYAYAVVAVNAAGCESKLDNPVGAVVADRAILSAAAVVVDDRPRGNRSGFADPGEEVDLVLTLRNAGGLDAVEVTGRLVAETPDVTLLADQVQWSSIAAGGQAAGSGVLRFVTPPAVECGEPLRFRLELDEGAGCVVDDSYFDVPLGQRVASYDEPFESAPGWTLDAASSTAVAGAWTWGDPDPTAYQPGDDVSDPGVNAWFTAPNPGGEGFDDVDGGVTVVRSPIVDLSGLTTADLSLWRWFANRDLGDDEGDFFAIDASANGGSTWVNLETLGSNVSAPDWTRRTFSLEDTVGLTSQMRFRVRVADGTAIGGLIEAAFDEVRIDSPVCDATPACYVPPTFAGAAAATPGSSCGETTVTWTAARSNCQNATISYSVYRSTVPGFVPAPDNRVAAGVTGSSWNDTLLQPGATYHYIVRADDSRSGQDGNLVRRTVVSPSSPDVRAPVFGGLATAGSGASCGEVVLTWSAAAESCNGPVHYEVYRSTSPTFTPSLATRVASTLSAGYVDGGAVPGVGYTYIVRARDEAGNEDDNLVRQTVAATILDRPISSETFESGPSGWAVASPNTAVTGRFELGDPEGTSNQAEDDHTVPGVNAWVTGLAAAGGGGGNDIDDGQTTVLSPVFNLAGRVDPEVRYWVWFSNDGGNNPGEDPLLVDVSNDGGTTWKRLDTLNTSALAWVERRVRIVPVVAPTANIRLRFVAADQGIGGSLVEAAIDDIAIADLRQGCSGCPSPTPGVGRILASRVGDDVVLDWSADPVSAGRYAVYRLSGSTLSDEVRIGTSDGKTFVHEGAVLSGDDFYYRVTAIDACGQESPVP